MRTLCDWWDFAVHLLASGNKTPGIDRPPGENVVENPGQIAHHMASYDRILS